MSFTETLQSITGKLLADCTDQELYLALLELVRQKSADRVQPVTGRKLYYISAEFLIGKLLSNNLINLGLYDEARDALAAVGKSLSDIEEVEPEPSLGNGGLGRLAACFLDSLATLNLPGDGVGLRMMADCSAWRNTSVRVTESTAPLRRMSPSTLPGPTEGSWSGSPTITRRHPGFRAASRASISGRSTMLISSTMTASASSRSFSFFLKATSPVSSLKVMPRQRWMVWASREHSSLIRLAARPVGASSSTVRPMRSSRVTVPRVEVVLPVPGPPVSSSTPLRAASSTARRCWGA